MPDDVVAKIPDHAYAAWVRSATEQASIDGMKGTPTVAINGVMQDPQANPDDLNWSQEGALRAVRRRTRPTIANRRWRHSILAGPGEAGPEVVTLAKSVGSSALLLEAKRKAQAQVSAQARRRAVAWTVAGLVVVAVFAALVAYIVRQGDVSDVSGEGQLDLAVASDNGGIPVGSTGVVGESLDESRVRLDIYFDFICPACGGFEQSQSETVNALRSEGLVDVYYHPLGYLDEYSQGTQYSTRAASAAALVAAESPDMFLAFVEAMFVNQPAENTHGPDGRADPGDRIAGGRPGRRRRAHPRPRVRLVGAVGHGAGQQGRLPFTPTLAINGVMENPRDNPGDLNWSVDGALEQAIRDAAGQ